MPYQWNFGQLWPYAALFWRGAVYTVGFTILTAVLGLLTGAVLALGRLSGTRWLRAPLGTVIEVFRCTPVLVQLVWCYYALPVLTGLDLSPAAACVLTLSLYGGSFYAEIIRGGLQSVGAGQRDAGRALGLTRGMLLRHVVAPQAFRHSVPPLVNQTILQLKNTSLVSVVAVPDLLYQGQLVTSATYRPLETYTLVAVLYFLMLFPLTRLAQCLETRLGRSGT